MAAARSLSLGLRLGRGSIYVNTAGKWTGCPFPYCISVMQTALSTSTPLPFVFHQYRYSSFFNKLTADELWRGVLAEFGAGARKGRGKRTKRKMKKDLNRGQMIGEGRAGFLWPGLNAPVVKSGTIQSIGKRDQSQQEVLQAEVLREREEWDKRRKMKIKRERGWTGNSWGGISLGPPDPGPNGETFEDFDSRVIEVMQDEREHTRGQHTLDSFAAYRPRTISSSSSGPSGNRFQRFVVKSVFNMTAKEGRKRSVSALVVVGNGNGAAGFALGKAPDRTTALRKAKNRAIYYLYYIERYNSHTIYQDITSRFKRTTIKMKKKNYGYGLHCHRAIITICKLIGIKDMYAKVSGSTNLLNITRALFQGLSNQETHSDLANKKELHVVEFRNECGPLPLIVASPHGAVRKVPEPEDEIPDTKLDWSEIKAAQGMKRSVWANVKRTIW